MMPNTDSPPLAAGPARGLRSLLRSAPVPLFPMQPVLGWIVRSIARRRPEIFERIGPHTSKCFVVDPTDMPFVLVLHPDPIRPRLRAARRRHAAVYDARIAGSFLTLLAIADGRLDGDSLFFTRELVVEGDTEAALCLRHALDDLDGSIADDIAEMFGPPGRATVNMMRRMGKHGHE